jgi:glutamate-1-semialdehyde 2,1-aminomutase
MGHQIVSRSMTTEDSALTLQSRAHAAIPGGAHTYAKGDDQFPVSTPGFIARGSGCHVWDTDGNEFIEYGMGLRAVGLGHAFPAVIAAAADELTRGANFTRPSPLEVECAESLLEAVPGADMVKFTKDGSTATTAAIRLARAFTGRDMIALCADHPFYSYDDWAICTKTMDAGIPERTKGLTLSFRYNDLASVAALFAVYPNRIAAIILEAEKDTLPADGFLIGIREMCTRNGTLLIFDEMITGFRWPTRSAQTYYGVEPDLSTFGKALGNGFAISALAGKREVMVLGGRDHGAKRVFLLSTTHGAETHALAAALAVMKVYREEPVIETLDRQGERLASGVTLAAARHGLSEHFQLSGRSSNLVYACCDRSGLPSQLYRTLFLQEIGRHGILAPSLVTSYSHSDDDIDRTIEAIDRAFGVYAQALQDGVERYLIGRPVRPVFSRDGDAARETEVVECKHAVPQATPRAQRRARAANSRRRSQYATAPAG